MKDVADMFPEDACASLDTDADGFPDSVINPCTTTLLVDVDQDGDGLIEISNINDLATIRDDLNGDGLDDALFTEIDSLGSNGCGGQIGITICDGYELVNNLDFNDPSSYSDTDLMNIFTNRGISQSVSGQTISGWVPVGTNGTNSFSARFEGNNFAISNLYIHVDDENAIIYVGFFGGVDLNSEITNLGLYQVSISGSVSKTNSNQTWAYVAGLIGGQFNGGMVSNVTVQGSISSFSDSEVSLYSGGLVGTQSNGGTILNSAMLGDVFSFGSVTTGNNFIYAGGLVGTQGPNASISNSVMLGSVFSFSNVVSDMPASYSYSYSGGLVARQSGGSILSSMMVGSVFSSSISGGLVGEHSNDSDLLDSIGLSVVSGNDLIGGLVGTASANMGAGANSLAQHIRRNLFYGVLLGKGTSVEVAALGVGVMGFGQEGPFINNVFVSDSVLFDMSGVISGSDINIIGDTGSPHTGTTCNAATSLVDVLSTTIIPTATMCDNDNPTPFFEWSSTTWNLGTNTQLPYLQGLSDIAFTSGYSQQFFIQAIGLIRLYSGTDASVDTNILTIEHYVSDLTNFTIDRSMYYLIEDNTSTISFSPQGVPITPHTCTVGIPVAQGACLMITIEDASDNNVISDYSVAYTTGDIRLTRTDSADFTDGENFYVRYAVTDGTNMFDSYRIWLRDL